MIRIIEALRSEVTGDRARGDRISHF